jgi:hypothetical protein
LRYTKVHVMTKKRKKRYIRAGVFSLDEVLPFVFTREIRHGLRQLGFDYRSKEWIEASGRFYKGIVDGKVQDIWVSMGSHRYQLFAEKGTTCIKCGLKGSYFALERSRKSNPNKFHFNLYGKDDKGRHIMLTKDHIKPRSKGGKKSAN